MTLTSSSNPSLAPERNHVAGWEGKQEDSRGRTLTKTKLGNTDIL